MDCPICCSLSQRLFSKYSYWIRQCVVCRHQFAELVTTSDSDHVEQVYSDRYFQGGKAGYSDYISEAAILLDHSKRYAEILKRYMQPETVLDVGAAAGFILQGLVESGWSGQGIEPNTTMAEYGKQHLGLDIEVGTLESCNSSDRYQLISMIQVIAHFRDLRAALSRAAAMTQPQGFWLIETWNRESCTARSFGKYWHEYSPPSVLHWFSPEDIQSLAGQYGFREVARGRPAKWLNGSHAKSLLKYKLLDLPLGKLAYKTLDIIPDDLKIPYPAEDLCWLIFQKS